MIDYTYSAGWTADDSEVTVMETAPAAVSGPAETFAAATREDAERALFDGGYLVAGEWTEHTNGWFVDLTRMF